MSGAAMPDADREACERIRSGDVSGVDELLRRHYAAAELLASTAVAAGSDPAESVAVAWEQLIRDAAAGAVAGGVRGALLERVIAVLDKRGLLDSAEVPPPPRRPFLPADDRWAGWWDDEHEPEPWPSGTVLSRALVMRALRRVPVGLRVLLILRDAAGISGAEAEPTVHVPAAQQGALLDAGREAYLAAVDDEVERSHAGL